jgi:hypothetical protein
MRISIILVRCLGAMRRRIVFIQDVGELGRIEYLAAELALDKLDVLLAGDDANLGMFAQYGHKGGSLGKVCPCAIGLSIAKFRKVVNPVPKPECAVVPA